MRVSDPLFVLVGLICEDAERVLIWILVNRVLVGRGLGLRMEEEYHVSRVYEWDVDMGEWLVKRSVMDTARNGIEI